MKLLSIIIPVYNVEKYLHNCISSILRQRFTDYELLLIDDGSTDTSGEICDRCAAEDPRIRVFHEKNGGPSRARNIGLKAAEGQYVQFVDADDELYPDSLGAMAQRVTDASPELIMAQANTVDAEGNVLKRLALRAIGETSIPEILGSLDYEEKAVLLHYLWNKWYRKDIIIHNALAFDEGERLGEDFLFNSQFVRFCGRIVLADTLLYKYYKRNNGSLSGKFVPDELRRRRRMDGAFLELLGFLGFEQAPERALQMIGEVSFLSIGRVFAPGCPDSWMEKRRFVKAFLDSEYLGYLRAYKASGTIKGKLGKVLLTLLCCRLVDLYLLAFALDIMKKRRHLH